VPAALSTSSLSLSGIAPRGAPNGGGKRRLKRTDAGVLGLRLGRYPFAAAVEAYIDSRVGIVADSTLREERRKLKYLAKIFESLKRQGLIRSTDPRTMTPDDMRQFMAWMRRSDERTGKKTLDPETQMKYLQYLRGMLKHFDNPTFEKMEKAGVRFPTRPRKAIRTIALEDLVAVFSALETMEGWRGSVARGMIALYFATGVRPSELRRAHFEDLKLDKMKLFVRHPKGEGSWAQPQDVEIIRPDMMRLVLRYLKERGCYLEENDFKKATALFPNLYRGMDEFYSANCFNEIKGEVEDLSGVDFRLKDFRPTLTTMTVNGDLSLLPAMSVQLRHANLATTQRHYAAIEQGAVGRKLREAWKNTPVSITPKNAVIENENEDLDMNSGGPAGI